MACTRRCFEWRGRVLTRTCRLQARIQDERGRTESNAVRCHTSARCRCPLVLAFDHGSGPWDDLMGAAHAVPLVADTSAIRAGWRAFLVSVGMSMRWYGDMGPKVSGRIRTCVAGKRAGCGVLQVRETILRSCLD